jgi:hypothetical protein
MRSLRQKLTALLLAVTTLYAASAQAIFTNGGFETGNFTGWTKVKGYNNGLKGSPPFSLSSLNVDFTYGTELLSTVGAIQDPRTDNLLPLPGAGKYTAKINDENSSSHFNAISQQDLISEADRGSDGKLHVKFSYAAVLEDPQHNPEEQPFFYVLLRDVTNGQILYSEFTYSNQPGRSFHTSTYGYSTWKWTDWNNIDITVPDSSVGHTLEIAVAAADCSLGAHAGYVYLDGFGSQGSTITNMSVSSLSPSTASAGGQSFTLTVYGSGFQSGDVVQWNGFSRQTTYVSSSQLNAVILDADLSTAGTAYVTVSRGTQTSSSLSFGIGGSTTSCNGVTRPTFISSTYQVCLPVLSATEVFASGTYTATLDYVQGSSPAQWRVSSAAPTTGTASATYSRGVLNIPALVISGWPSTLNVTLNLKSASSSTFELVGAQ